VAYEGEKSFPKQVRGLEADSAGVEIPRFSKGGSCKGRLLLDQNREMDGSLGPKEPEDVRRLGFKDGSGVVEMGITEVERGRGRVTGSDGETGSSDSPWSSIAFISPRDDGQGSAYASDPNPSAGEDDIVTLSFSIDEADRCRS
jgi:hypothetical protein